jgi:hypothetical protein
MKLYIRVPIGLMFLLIGGMLLAYGLFTAPIEVPGSAGHNVNAWWDALMALFGLVMFGSARRARCR